MRLLWLAAVLLLFIPRLQCACPEESAGQFVAHGATLQKEPSDYMVSILNGAHHLCTGVLVGPMTIVTSADCLPSKEDLRGEENLFVSIGRLEQGTEKEAITVEEVVFPKGFEHVEKACFKSQDIALLLLKDPIENTPIEIISEKKWKSIKDKDEMSFTAKGWFSDEGESDACLGNAYLILRRNASDCEENTVKGKLICATGDEKNKISVSGTTFSIWAQGAPLIYDEGEEVVAGVWAFLSKKCRSLKTMKNFIAYTPLAPFKKWIESPPKKGRVKIGSGK